MTKDIVYDSWLKSIRENKTSALATVLQVDSDSYEPSRMFLNEDGEMTDTIQNDKLVKVIKSKMEEKLNEKNSQSETIEMALNDGSIINLFIDVYTPPAQILIFGAGHDAVPVARYSMSLGFHTTVVDAREGFNNERDFPGAERIIVHPENFDKEVAITKNTYVIVMNHHIVKDTISLKYALESDAPYVGVLGPRSRREKMMNQLYEENTVFTDSELAKMYNPVGLDIGADSPEEIAISIISEIIAITKGHNGGFLHDKNSIHKYTSKYELPVKN
ncbi:MAG TPA: XdhC family protein [Candidatus Salinicoccus merdavium]|nr:XdhC family protein [Candidatus Salinicoccus merdavium]